jgi:hypothetical protein
MVRTEVTKTSREDKVTVVIETEGYDSNTKTEIVNWIDGEFANILTKYVKNEDKRNEILNTVEDLFGVIIAFDDRNYSYFSVKEKNYDVTVTSTQERYDVKVELTKKIK